MSVEAAQGLGYGLIEFQLADGAVIIAAPNGQVVSNRHSCHNRGPQGHDESAQGELRHRRAWEEKKSKPRKTLWKSS